MRRAVFASWSILVALFLTACGSYRYAVPLDAAERAELSELRGDLEGLRVHVELGEWQRVPDELLVAALPALGVTVEAAPTSPSPGSVEVRLSRSGEAHCLNPALPSALTLGILPYVFDATVEFRCTVVAADGLLHAARWTEGGTEVLGWLGLPFGLLPGRAVMFFGLDSGPDRGVTRGDRVTLGVGRALREATRSKDTVRARAP